MATFVMVVATLRSDAEFDRLGTSASVPVQRESCQIRRVHSRASQVRDEGQTEMAESIVAWKDRCL